MAQHDSNIQNADGATVRADLNSFIEAIQTQNSGSLAPSPTFPYMFWYDTSVPVLKQRNGANTGWVELLGDSSVTTSTGTQALAEALNGRAIYVSSIAALTALDTAALVDGQQALVDSYNAGSGYGGGQFYWDAAATEAANDWSIFGSGTGRWKRREASIPKASHFGLAPGGDLYAAVNTAVSNGSISALEIDLDCVCSARMSTASPLVVTFSPDVTLDVTNDDGLFFVNSAPFHMLGDNTLINHSSQVLFVGNDSTKFFDGITVSGFRFKKTSAGGRNTLYFPNIPMANVVFSDLLAEDYDLNDRTADFIQIEWGLTETTRDILVRDVVVHGYRRAFMTGGSGVGDRLTVRNFTSIDASEYGFCNYHFWRSDLDLTFIRNALPAYIWGGDSVNILAKAYDSLTDGVRIEQLQSHAQVFSEGQVNAGCLLTWGSNHCTLDVNNIGGECALKVTPYSNAVSSTISGITLNVVSQQHTVCAVRFEQDNRDSRIGEVNLTINATDAATGAESGVRGRNLSPLFDLHINGGRIDNSHALAVDLRTLDPTTEVIKGFISGVELRSNTASLIRTDKSDGRMLVIGCLLDDFSKLSNWKTLAGNAVVACFDDATKTAVP